MTDAKRILSDRRSEKVVTELPNSAVCVVVVFVYTDWKILGMK